VQPDSCLAQKIAECNNKPGLTGPQRGRNSRRAGPGILPENRRYFRAFAPVATGHARVQQQPAAPAENDDWIEGTMNRIPTLLGCLFFLLACGDQATVGDDLHSPAGPDAGDGPKSPSDLDSVFDFHDLGADAPRADAGACPPGIICVGQFPFIAEGDTRLSNSSVYDSYPCKSSADESGNEFIYRVDLPQPGFLSAAVYDDSGVDIDLHILSSLDASSCISRGDKQVKADVEAGTYYVVADSYVSGGQSLAGVYRIEIGFTIPSQGPCLMESGEMARVGDGGNHLQMPATGPMVLEAHLVTQEEPAPYPATSTDELKAHYQLSQSRSGFVMMRSQVWAPLEGGTFYGAGIGSPNLFPVLDEHWYVNMYWTKDARPARGTRMILQDPQGSRAVVVAAGYETGPGNLSRIGGSPEETHYYLATSHLDTLTLGIASDQTLPLGPRICQ
jgi:hypothetical protein